MFRINGDDLSDISVFRVSIIIPLRMCEPTRADAELPLQLVF